VNYRLILFLVSAITLSTQGMETEVPPVALAKALAKKTVQSDTDKQQKTSHATSVAGLVVTNSADVASDNFDFPVRTCPTYPKYKGAPGNTGPHNDSSSYSSSSEEERE